MELSKHNKNSTNFSVPRRSEDFPRNYDPKISEKKWLKYWGENNTYKFNPNTKKEIYTIDTPPPTVSGKMHIGHAFSFSQQDFVARYKRMRGFEVFYPFGTDDNGLPTDKLVEKINKVRSKNMERKEYVKLCLKTLKDLLPKFIQDWKNIGMSCDFDVYYSTINDHCQKISQKSFLDLYKMGREYRKDAPTLWCPQCHQAIAQVELEDREQDSTFNDIIFKLPDNKDLVIATTRPELLCACVSIFYHPDDKRYQKYKGKKAKVPLFDYEVPILPDEKADPEKGTGIVMCCTFGDQTDMEWYFKHSLPLKTAFTENGKMTGIAKKYEGLSIKEARKQILSDLKDKKLLVNQKPIKHTVNVHERCGTEIEILHSKQWFLKYLDLKPKFLAAGKKLKWYPKHMINRYENWINGLQWDWCLSRQRHFGVPIPVWYCKKCDEIITAKENQLPVDPIIDKPSVSKCPKCGSGEFIPEKDILDTWATSALTPTLAADLFKGHPVHKKLYPMNLRPQAHDIITFWLFNTVVKSQIHDNVNPWGDVMISGWALDPHGKKMSKSKGNIVEPQEVLDKYSADALRFWAGGSKLGEDLPYQEKDIVTGKKVVNKLWNSTKFAIMHLQDYDMKKPKELLTIDRWLLSKLHRIIKVSTENFDKYEYSKTKSETEKFFWMTLCDNYLEIIKDRIYNPDKWGKDARKSAQYTLYTAFLSVLKLFAPIMPFITEEIYHLYFSKKEGIKSIHNSSWPEFDKNLVDDKAEKAGDMAVDIISVVRKFKSENAMSLKEELEKIVIDAKAEDKKLLELVLDDIKATSKANEIEFGKEADIKCSKFEIKIGIKK